jgi:uncharacterized delta-60 repeat protein
MRSRFAALLLPFLAAACGVRESSPVAPEATGTVDGSFGGGGLALTPQRASPQGVLTDLVVLDDGSIVVASENTYLARLTPDGLPDLNFGSGGVDDTRRGTAQFQKVAQLARARGDRLLVVEHHSGTCQFRFCDAGFGQTIVRRIDANGAPDPTYGDAGIAATKYLGKAAVTTSGRVATFAFPVFPMETLLVVSALDSDGEVDAGFGPRVLDALNACGRDEATFYRVDSIAALAVGERFVVASSFSGFVFVQAQVPFAQLVTEGICITRFEADGRIDATFGAGSRVIVPKVASNLQLFRLLRQASGELLLILKGSGVPPAPPVGYRIGANGGSASLIALPALDHYFEDVALQENGKLVTAGFPGRSVQLTQPSIARRSASDAAQVDGTFGVNGSVPLFVHGQTLIPHKITVDSEGRVVVGGNVLGTGQVAVFRIR